ncbi:MAG: hypothetical protein H8E57_06775, partial [Candidatus Cloacimonetes bacterium]|nr:hypothetical protein [Candidatus Cloacimonadota bacterium]
MPNFFPLSPTQLIDYYSTYIKGAIKYMVELNYDQTDIDAMSALLSALESSHTGHLAAKTALKEAVELRDGKVKLVAADVMKRSRIIQASELDNVVLKAMGLP